MAFDARSFKRKMSSSGSKKLLMSSGGEKGRAKHLVKRNYELWLSFGTNRRREYLALTVQWSRNTKGIFFPGGFQRNGWWKLMVASYELADRPVKFLSSVTEKDKRK